MKFAVRDDDINYFYTPKLLEKYYKEVWDFCPISISVIPFIKGNWKKNIDVIEKLGPGSLDNVIINKILSDNDIYPLGENFELLEFIQNKIKQGSLYITIHGIHHRNEDRNIPHLGNNYGFGAEFYTSRYLGENLKKSIQYLENIFDQKISVFTPPQNVVNKRGFDAITYNNLNVCMDFPRIKNFDTLSILGLKSYLQYLFFKLKYINHIYYKSIKTNNISICPHHRLQPNSDLDSIKKQINYVYKKNGIFVLSTHSYAFDYKMNNNFTMGEIFLEIINFVREKNEVKFVSINKIFD